MEFNFEKIGRVVFIIFIICIAIAATIGVFNGAQHHILTLICSYVLVFYFLKKELSKKKKKNF